MWVRKRIDIGWRDLCFGLLQCLWPGRSEPVQAELERLWCSDGSSLACLSVRTAWDLYLSAVAWPADTEVLISAITIPDMVRVLDAHGLVAVPLDLDPVTAFPRLESIRERATSRTRGVLLAPLFGASVPLDEHFAVARELELQCIVDCAQAYRGPGFRGEEHSDVSMFSFGPIKNATALGGALLTVRDPRLLARMREIASRFPLQSRRAYAIRTMKYMFIKLLATRGGLRLLMKSAHLFGRDPDDWLNQATRGFPPAELLQALRRRPAYPLLKLLARRLRRDDPRRREMRVRTAEFLAHRLAGVCACPTAGLSGHTYWLFPILVDDPVTVRMRLREAGFDSSRAHSLRVVQPRLRDQRTAPCADDMLRRLVFLPLDESMPASEQDRMADIVHQAVGGCSPPTCRTPS